MITNDDEPVQKSSSVVLKMHLKLACLVLTLLKFNSENILNEDEEKSHVEPTKMSRKMRHSRALHLPLSSAL